MKFFHEIFSNEIYFQQCIILSVFQVGPKKWLEPKTDEVLGELSQRGRRSVVIVPVAFTSDHIETLHELDIEFAEEAEKANIK